MKRFRVHLSSKVFLINGAAAFAFATSSLAWSGTLAPRAGAESVDLSQFAAPVQSGIASPDSPTSFDATLPNGRRVTPAGSSVQVGENPLNSVLTPDGQYLIVSNDDERNVGAINTKYSAAAVNGAGKTPGGFVLSVVRTSDMQVVGTAVVPVNSKPNPGPKAPGKSQSDKTNGLFIGLAVKSVSGGGYTLYASGGYSDLVYAYNVAANGTLSLQTSIPIPVPTDPLKPNYGMAMPAGMTLSPDGSRLYVVTDNANTVVTIDTAANVVTGQPIPVGYFPYTAQLAPDGSKLYVTNWGVADRSFGPAYQASYNPTTGSGTGSLFIGGGSAHRFDNPTTDINKTSSVSILSLTSTPAPFATVSMAKPIDGINVVGGTHPSAMATVTNSLGSVLYVANANEDTLGLIDTRSDYYLGKIPMPSIVPGYGTRVQGQEPDALAASPDGSRLYVAEAGINAVTVFDTTNPRIPRYLGRIPTGWYPTGVTVSPDGSQLYITNAKGLGGDFGFHGQTAGNVPDVNLLFGTVQKVATAGLDLGAGATQVQRNTYQVLSSQSSTMNSVRAGIKHVFFILRENKTYDTYFGDDPTLNARGANGQPSFAQYGPYVPNSKSLAEQFAIGDNAYADSEESNAGHYFALAGGATDYLEKTLLQRFARPFLNTKNQDPEDYPLRGFQFHNAARSGVSYRDYGDLIRLSGYDEDSHPNPCVDDPFPGCNPTTYDYKNTTAPTVGLGGLYTENVPAMKALAGHIDPNYPGWALKISDQRRELEFEKDMNRLIANGQAPAFTYIWLPNDHTGGGLNPQFEVSDNDAALGKMVDYLSHGPLWKDSAIFVTQDDGQSSPDHVSAHRSYTMVISPYARRNTVVHRLSSTVSIPKTIEELLGMPPMNIGDLVANDLSDYFTTTPDFTPYNALPQAALPIPGKAALRIAKLTSRLDYSTYDRDNGRLGMLNSLFMQSEELQQHRAHLPAAAYGRAQDALYARALRIVAGPVLSGEDANWRWHWMINGYQPVNQSTSPHGGFVLGSPLAHGVLASTGTH